MDRMSIATFRLLLTSFIVVSVTDTTVPHMLHMSAKARKIDAMNSYHRVSEDLHENTCDDVAIIGAGVTGSYTAWRLRQRGLKVTLYEYSNRIGGRFHTVKLPGIPDINAELGAMRFIPNAHTLLNQTVHDLGLNVVDFELGIGSTSDTLYYLRDQHMTYNDLPRRAPYNIPNTYRYDFKTFLWHMFTNYTTLDNIVGDPLSHVNKQRIRSLDGVPLGMQSRNVYDAKFFDAETIKYYSDAISFQSDAGILSAAFSLPSSDPNQATGPNIVKTVAEGFQAIPKRMVQEFLAASFRHSFQANHQLISIRRHISGNYIMYFQPTVTRRGRTVHIRNTPLIPKCAKKAVLAITQMALQRLDWPVLRRSDIRDMLDNSVNPAQAVKIYFGYESTWWQQLPRATQYAISTTPLRQTYDFGKSLFSSKGVLNTAYTDVHASFWRNVKEIDYPAVQGSVCGDRTLTMSKTSVYLARKYYAEAFDVSVNDVPMPDSAVMAIWDSFPFGASWYEWMPGYIWEDVEAKMMKPSLTDEVFITGNIFSSAVHSGWSEGGLRLTEKLLTML